MAVGRVGDVLRIDRLALLAGNFGDRNDAFHRADVRQLRRSEHDVADGVDAGLGGLHPAVGLDEAAIGLDLRFFQADVFGARLAADGDQDFLGFDFLRLAIHAEGHGHAGSSSFRSLSTLAPVWKLMPRLR